MSFFAELSLSTEDCPPGLILGICAETATQRRAGGPRTSRQSASKFRMMKKVSTSFRFLVTQTPPARRRFVEFLRADHRHSALWMMKATTVRKVNRIVLQWGQALTRVGGDRVRFREWLRQFCANSKLKLPWLLVDVREAIRFCLKDLESQKLRKDFEAVREVHFGG